jgi:hypothetical protein
MDVRRVEPGQEGRLIMVYDYVRYAQYYGHGMWLGHGVWPTENGILTTADENKALARVYFEEVWNQGRVDLLDELYAPALPTSDHDSPRQLKERILWWHQVAPGLKFTILDTVAEDDRVVTHWRVNVTYTVPPEPPPVGPFLPLGKPVSWEGFELMRVAGGKIVSRKYMNGWTDLLVEVGAIRRAEPQEA